MGGRKHEQGDPEVEQDELETPCTEAALREILGRQLLLLLLLLGSSASFSGKQWKKRE
jgi:hypothetical protein